MYKKDHKIGSHFTYTEIHELFADIKEHGPLIIGECFICAKDPNYPDYHWSFVMTGMTVNVAIFTLIHKYDGIL